MTGKEKLQLALRHADGPVPIDFGGSATTGMHCSVTAGLRDYYGLEKRPVRVHEPYQMLGYIEEDLREAMGIDVVGIMPRTAKFGFPLENWKEWRTPWGQEVLVPGAFNVKMGDGDLYIFPQGDTEAPPSGHMPSGGYFFDSIVRQPPIDEENLNADDNLEEVQLLIPDDLAHFGRACREAAEAGKGVILDIGGTAFGDISDVPGPGLKYPKGIRDVTEWYVSTLMRQDLIHEMYRKRLDIVLKNLEMVHDTVGEIPDALFLCGTDFGTQSSQFCSLETYEELWAPYYREMNAWIHRHTGWRTFKHSCGAVEPFMEAFIESGFDIINPVQCSAVGMDPRRLKERYGQRLTFWGGGIDTQKTLPFGTAEEVRQEASERLGIFSRSGGYVFNAIHNIQAKTPIEHVAALLDAAHRFNEGR